MNSSPNIPQGPEGRRPRVNHASWTARFARAAAAGYTLLEVMIAMSILAVGLAILLGSQANSALMTERANHMALAALLARSKMLDVEHEILSDGFSDMMETMRGDFRTEGFQDITWDAIIEVVEIPPEATGLFAEEINAQLFGEGGEQGVLSGSAAVSQWLPMLFAEIPNLINDMATRARFVTLTVTWPDGRHTMSLTVQQYVVNLRPGGTEVDVQTIGGPPVGAPGGRTVPRGLQ